MSSCTRRCSFRVAPIDENSSLLPPVGVWAVLNPSVADRPLRPATDRRLGKLLPHQLANRAQAPPPASCDFVSYETYAVLSAISRRYSSPKGRLPTCYSPVRHSLIAECVRLACVRHAASVYPEPGSNSPSSFYITHPIQDARKSILSCDHDQVTLLLLLDLIRRLILFLPAQGRKRVDRKLLDKQFASSAFHSSIVKVTVLERRSGVAARSGLSVQTTHFVRLCTVAIVSHIFCTMSRGFLTNFS